MSDEKKPLEFSAFDLMPEWAQESPSSKGPSRSEKRERERDDRDEHEGKGGRRDQGKGKPPGRGGPRHRDERGGRGPRDRDDRRGGPRQRRDDRGGRGDRRGRGRRDDDRPEKKEEDPPAAGVTVSIEPTDAAVAGLIRHIRDSLRAFPVADLAKMVLRGRDRYQLRFRSEENGPALHRCRDDGSLWLDRDEAVNHVLNGPLVENYYRVEEVDVGAPSGNFNAVAVCGLSGVMLGPPNHHEYQRKVARLHAERFSHMAFERYKSRIVMEHDEETIERWKAEVGRVEHYRPRGTEDEASGDAVVLKSRDELLRHFREHFAGDAITEKREAVVPGDIPGKHLSRGLLAHVKQETEKQRRGLPLPMIQALCRAFETEGLKFFKRGKKALHVCTTRPRAIGGSMEFSDQVRRIVDFVAEHDRCRVVELLEALADDFQKPAKDAPSEQLELSDGARAVLKDLRWLTSEGYVLEFPDTRLALGKKPQPGRPEKKQPTAKASKKKKSSGRRKAAGLPATSEPSPATGEAESGALVDPAAWESEPNDPGDLPDAVDPVQVE